MRTISIFFLITIIITISASSASSQFIRVESGPAVSDGGWSFGVSWIDYDGDDYPDLFICNEDFSGSPAPNYLYHNNGDGSYTRVLEGDIGASGGCLASTWADFDGDGDLDCYAARPFLNANLLYINNGDGTFTSDTSTALTDARKFSMEVAWIDFDNDGRLDMFVANHGRPSDPALAEVYHNGKDGFAHINNSDLGLIEDEANGMALGDFDGDGRQDLFWTRNNKLSLLYKNSGDGRFTQMTELELIEGSRKYFGNWADFDNDGYLDIYVMSDESGVTLYKNRGNGAFEPIINHEMASDTGNWTAGYWGDYDNDGWLDLLVLGQKNYAAYPNRLYHNNGDGSFTRVVNGPIATDNEPSAAAAWADHDRDGDLDLFVANVGNTNNALYENTGNQNHWLQIKLEGTGVNKSAIGAKIRIRAEISGNAIWQMREISAKNGFKSQSDLVAHFGLGDATDVDSLIVEWPDFTQRILTNIKADQLLKIARQ
ncbi:MAG: CRTAC1 family protein [Candidatus Zixiibacteriota bacterium]